MCNTKKKKMKVVLATASGSLDRAINYWQISVMKNRAGSELSR